MARNPSGRNQHSSQPALTRWPQLPELIQDYLSTHTPQKDIPDHLLRDHNIDIKLRTVERIISKQKLRTTRRSGYTDIERGAAILALTEAEDPLGRWGARKLRDRLALEGVLASRQFIADFLREHNLEATIARHPSNRRGHPNGLWSAGPNEEWNVDGHEKILDSMGIAVWGVCDKFSRLELGLWALPDARHAAVPPSCFLLLVKKYGGIPTQLVSDKGSETGILAALQYTLRTAFMPDIDPMQLPPHRFLTSTRNITRERGWGPIWHQELSNIKYVWESGKFEAGFCVGNEIHEGIARWLWAKIVQNRLNKYMDESKIHRVRYQKNILLPSGARRIDIYTFPERHRGVDCLIKIPEAVINRLIAEHYNPKVFQFGSDPMVKLCEELYTSIGSPQLASKNGWAVFRAMVDNLANCDQYQFESIV